jgi:multidrug resistance protein, MATE family
LFVGDCSSKNQADVIMNKSSSLVASEKDPLLPVKSETGLTEDTNKTNSSFEDDDDNTPDKDDEDDHAYSSYSSLLWSDAKDTIRLSFPIFIATLSWVGMKTTDTALLGHVSANALSAAALSDLWTMCTQMFVQAPVLGILVGSAVGAGNAQLAGIYLRVSILVLAVVAMVVFICWNMTELIWTWFGSDPQIASMAGYYARYVVRTCIYLLKYILELYCNCIPTNQRFFFFSFSSSRFRYLLLVNSVLSWSLPGQVLLSQLTQFFSSQRIMHPEVNASSAALILNLVLGLVFVLGIPIDFLGIPGWSGWSGFGFAACPIVTSVVEYIQLFIIWFIYIYQQRLHEPAWSGGGSGWDWKELTWTRITTFCELYIPSAFGMASDFWRVAVIGMIAAQIGEVEVAVFNTSFRIMWIVLTAVNALASASAIKMSLRLGKANHRGAQRAGEMGIFLAALVLLLIGAAVYWKNEWFGKIFSSDQEFLALFESARLPFTLSLVLMNLSVAIERIPYAMGRTKEVFWMGFVASWFAQVPAVVLFTRYWRNDLIAVYWGMTFGYLVLAILYAGIVLTSDWKKYAEIARQRSEISIVLKCALFLYIRATRFCKKYDSGRVDCLNLIDRAER